MKPAVREQDVLNQILRTLGVVPSIRLWRANVGVGVPYAAVQAALAALRAGNPAGAYGILSAARPVTFGVPGQADLTGILATGRRLEIEVKSAVGRQSADQRNYQAMIERLGGRYILARSVADVEELMGGST